MKKIDLICINILHKQWSSLIVLVIMIFMMFLINQSIGYIRQLYVKNRVYGSAANLDKSYWVELWPDKSMELNDAFKRVDTDKKYLETARSEIMKLPHVVDVSFIGNYQVKKGSETVDIYGYDDSMMSMVNVLIKKGRPISGANMNQVLISHELSDIYKIGGEIYINENNEITGQDTGHMAMKVTGVADARFLPGIIYKSSTIIVCPYKLLENYGIYFYSNSAVVRTDDTADLSDIYNETSPELGFFKKFDAYYNVNGSIEFLIKHLTKQICILVICLVCISSLNFAGLYGKKYEYGIYFLCGARIRDIIFLSTSKNLILIILSTIAGYIMTVHLSVINNISDRTYDFLTYALSFLFALGIYIVSSIPVYIELKTKDLIHLIKDVN